MSITTFDLCRSPSTRENKGAEKLFEDILFENFPNMGKKTDM